MLLTSSWPSSFSLNETLFCARIFAFARAVDDDIGFKEETSGEGLEEDLVLDCEPFPDIVPADLGCAADCCGVERLLFMLELLWEELFFCSCPARSEAAESERDEFPIRDSGFRALPGPRAWGGNLGSPD
jgi:hypothetical protein